MKPPEPIVQDRWPPERFYWAVLEAPGWRRSGPLPPGLAPQFQEEIPIAVDDLHAVCTPLGYDRVVVCAAPNEQLAAMTPGMLRLTPMRLPEHVDDDRAVDPLALNLLVGEHEPLPLSKDRWRRHLAAAAVVLLVSAFATVGLVRRAQVWSAAGAQALSATATVLRNANLAYDSTAQTLAVELAHLHRVSDASDRLQPPTDAGPALASLLQAWPTGVPAKPQSVAISDAGAAVSVLVEGDPAPFLTALKPPAGWSMDEPRLNRTGELTRLSLQLHPPKQEARP